MQMHECLLPMTHQGKQTLNASSVYAECTVTCVGECSKSVLKKGEHADLHHDVLKRRDSWQTADP